MAVSYNRLWKLLIDRKKSATDLRRDAGICPNTLTRLRRDEPVTFAVLDKICKALNCDYGDIISYVPDNNDYTCPECGGKLDVMRIDDWSGIPEIIAACSQCELDWIWHLNHGGTAGKKRRFFHG